MDRDNSFFQTLWEKYLLHTATNEEQVLLMQMIDSGQYDSFLKEAIAGIYDQGLTDIPKNANGHSLEMWSHIQSHIEVLPTSVVPLHKSRSTQKWMWAAAILLFVISGTLLFRWYDAKDAATLEDVVMTHGSNMDSLMVLKQVLGPQNILLPDGTKVYLKRGSELQYDSLHFVQSSYRDVLVKGEIFFDVKHIKARPFVVHTGHLNTTVLGTSFDVNNNGNQVQVTVLTGRVGVNNDGQKLAILTPNKRMSYDLNAPSAHVTNVDAQSSIKWTEDFLIFKNLLFKDAATMIADKFKVQVVMNESVQKCGITASFEHGETLVEVLDVVCAVTNSKWTQSGDRIQIEGPGCE